MGTETSKEHRPPDGVERIVEKEDPI